MRAFSSSMSKVDLRAHPREQVNRPAKVQDGPFAIDALIKDISSGGLRLNFPGQIPSAEDFVVVDIEIGHAYACHMVWRKGPDCGLRILKTQDLRGLVSGQFHRAKHVWQHAAS